MSGEGSAHVSYSSLADFLKCGKLWELKRKLRFPERPAVWNVGGHAVHAAIEGYERAADREDGASGS